MTTIRIECIIITMKHSKLDRRHTGYSNFKYAAQFVPKEKHKFCDIREWAWTQWGPSCEMEFWDSIRNPRWCWVVDQYKIKIFFATDAEYQWFLLKWT